MARKGNCIQEDFSLTLGITGFGAGAPFPKLLWRQTGKKELQGRALATLQIPEDPQLAGDVITAEETEARRAEETEARTNKFEWVHRAGWSQAQINYRLTVG